MAARKRQTSTPPADAAGERLERYRAKRDFAVTPEPSGSAPPAAGGHRFVVQRHRARRLHYDLRLEAAGVLVSWAVPKGPTLDPDVRRMAVHVEDHPLDYFDFEGVIPAGEYGGGDVVVWDWGTWSIAEADDPLAAIEAGNLHFDLDGEKLRGRFVLVRTAGKGRDWLLLKKHDEAAVAGWDPEDHPQSVKSGRTNDEVRDAPAASWTGAASWAAPTTDELAALDALGKGGQWQLGEHTLKLTNLDKVLFPGRGPTPAFTKRDLIRHNATVAPVMLPYMAERPVNMHRYPNGVDQPGFWHKAIPTHAPDWVRRWRNPHADPGETQDYAVLDSPAALAWAANYGAVELHPWTSTVRDTAHPTWALFDIDPGTDSTFDDVVVLARLHRTALEHLGVRAASEGDGEAGHPDLDPGRRRVHVRPDASMGRAGLPGDRGHRAGARQLDLGGPRPRRSRPPRLHAERRQQDPRRSVQHPRRAGRPGVRPDHVGRVGRTRPGAGPVDDGHHRRAGANRRRPDGPTHRGPAATPVPVIRAAVSRRLRGSP